MKNLALKALPPRMLEHLRAVDNYFNGDEEIRYLEFPCDCAKTAVACSGHFGIPWLGFVVFPTHRRVKARKVRSSHRRLRLRLAAWHAGEISFGKLDASVRGWIEHVRHADS